MKKISGFINQKVVLYFSLLILVIHSVAKYSTEIGLCPSYPNNCNDVSYIVVIYTFIFIFVFLFSIITFFMKEKVASSWRFFSVWAVVLSLILITFLPTYTHGLDFVPLTKGTGILALSTLYAFISLILIIFKSIQLRNKN